MKGTSQLEASSILPQALVKLMVCPLTGRKLSLVGDELVTVDNSHRYKVSPEGLSLFAEIVMSEEGRTQQQHYDRIAAAYVTNLSYPHTIEYMGYLDRVLLATLPEGHLGVTAEICCGRGEVFHLVGDRVELGIGVDVSQAMLREARKDHPGDKFAFLQADATKLPLADASVDNVFMLGGIHHVNDRTALFSEIARILKPGGEFYYREPVSDFFLWRWLRALIYRISPSLDATTERPLLYKETAPVLERAGLVHKFWGTYGFFGFCIVMNNDVLVFNRAFRHVPGIRSVARWSASLDHFITSMPFMRRYGLQVFGCAREPRGASS